MIFDPSRCNIDWCGSDLDRFVGGGAVIGIHCDAITGFFTQERLPDCSLIGNNVAFGVAVPSPKDGITFFLP
jgi:hypothetical protein